MEARAGSTSSCLKPALCGCAEIAPNKSPALLDAPDQIPQHQLTPGSTPNLQQLYRSPTETRGQQDGRRGRIRAPTYRSRGCNHRCLRQDLDDARAHGGRALAVGIQVPQQLLDHEVGVLGLEGKREHQRRGHVQEATSRFCNPTEPPRTNPARVPSCAESNTAPAAKREGTPRGSRFYKSSEQFAQEK